MLIVEKIISGVGDKMKFCMTTFKDIYICKENSINEKMMTSKINMIYIALMYEQSLMPIRRLHYNDDLYLMNDSDKNAYIYTTNINKNFHNDCFVGISDNLYQIKNIKMKIKEYHGVFENDTMYITIIDDDLNVHRIILKEQNKLIFVNTSLLFSNMKEKFETILCDIYHSCTSKTYLLAYKSGDIYFITCELNHPWYKTQISQVKMKLPVNGMNLIENICGTFYQIADNRQISGILTYRITLDIDKKIIKMWQVIDDIILFMTEDKNLYFATPHFYADIHATSHNAGYLKLNYYKKIDSNVEEVIDIAGHNVYYVKENPKKIYYVYTEYGGSLDIKTYYNKENFILDSTKTINVNSNHNDIRFILIKPQRI